MITIDDLPEEGGLYSKTKLEWKEVDHLYIHYFYKITNNINGKFYYGIHSILKDDPKSNDLENDGYWGSGVAIHEAEIKYGLENFSKTIEATFSTRAEVRLKEAEVVTQELVDDRMCYNMVLGGCESPNKWQGGWLLVNYADKSLRKEKMFSIPLEEYYANKDKYITQSSGFVVVNFKDPKRRLPNFFKISSEEYYSHQDEYISTFQNKVAYKNSEDWSDIRWLDPDDPLVRSGQFVGVANGIKQSQETINKKVGEKNGSYGSTWITDGTNNKRIKLSDPIPIGWWKGRIIQEEKIKKCYINTKTGEHAYFLDEEVLNDCWTKDFLVDKDLNKITSNVLKKYLDSGYSRNQLSELFGMCVQSVSKLIQYYVDMGELNDEYIHSGKSSKKESTKYTYIKDVVSGKIRRVLTDQAEKFINSGKFKKA